MDNFNSSVSKVSTISEWIESKGCFETKINSRPITAIFREKVEQGIFTKQYFSLGPRQMMSFSCVIGYEIRNRLEKKV